MQKIELTVKEAFELEAEIADVLRKKAQIKLKYELMQIETMLKQKTEAPHKLAEELFKTKGKYDELKKTSTIPMYEEDGKTETEGWKELKQIHEQKIELEYLPVPMSLFGELDSDFVYPTLFKLITR